MVTAKTPPNPRIQLLEAGSKLACPEVLPPPNQVFAQFPDHLLDAPTTGTSRDLPDLVLEAFFGRLTDKELKPATTEAEAKELPLPRSTDRAFGFVHFELQLQG